MQRNEHNLSVILIFLFILSAVYAQNDVPIHLIDGDYLNEWLVLGPFFPADLEKDYLIHAGGEKNIEPKEGDIFVTAQNDTLKWKRCKTDQDILDLRNVIGKYQNATAYAYCKLNSETEGKRQFLIGSDDGVAVWLNGNQSHVNPAARQLYIDHDMFEAILNKGTNRCLVKVSQGLGNWGFTLRVSPKHHQERHTPKYYLSFDEDKDETGLPTHFWKYHSGDNEEWAKLDFDDSSWEFTNTEFRPNNLPKSGWNKVGWFRFHIKVDSSLINKPIGIYIIQAGESQLYLDGKLLYSFGATDDNWPGTPKVITFDDKKKHVIAIRYYNPFLSKFHDAGYFPGFLIRLGNVNRMAESRILFERPLIGYQMAFTALSLAIGLLHLILFAFSPGLKQNFYFALFLFAYAITIFVDYQASLSTHIDSELLFIRIHRAAYVFFALLQLRLVYALFFKKLPIQFWIISLLSLAIGSLVVYKPNENFGFFDIVDIILVVEICRVVISAIIKKQEGSWLIALAFLIYFIFGTFDSLMDSGVITPFSEMLNPYAYGSVGFFIAMSIYLSRDFARTNEKIATQEVERKLLEAENIRQANELEQARQLQLSMLPKELPQLPHLEIGVYMKTATEVGGDYYDFKQRADGTLTVVIGDATGHGMQAGTMVSATKSLFHALADEPEPLQFIKKGSEAIKAMGLKKMYMALTVAKFKDDYMQVASAGMPFPLIYRSSTGRIEEVALKGMPMGGFANFPYKDKKVQLNEGDTVLFMSDGFEEMFNPQDEMLGEEQVKMLFAESAENSPDKIIEHLKNAGESWANGRDQEDDVTFVVIKIK